MLPFLRRDLLIELHTHDCAIRRAAVLPNMFGRRRSREPLASGSGRGAQALSSALDNVMQADGFGRRLGAPLGRRAQMVVTDEYVDYAILESQALRWPSSVQEARARAHHRFADLLGHEDSLVEVTPLPGSQDWLCAAIDREEYTLWTEVLQAHGVCLTHVFPALIEDLRAEAAAIREPDAIAVFPRDEGAMMVRLSKGIPRHIHWVSLDPDELAIVELRVQQFARETAPVRRGGHRTVVYLSSRNLRMCRFVLDPMSANFQAPTPALRAA